MAEAQHARGRFYGGVVIGFFLGIGFLITVQQIVVPMLSARGAAIRQELARQASSRSAHY